jgi:AcrR family transcriptional regulator
MTTGSGGSSPKTKERLLDAAELLFAREGYHRTSLRALTAEAGVNLAAVNYHFGGKEALLGAVFDRRLKPLNVTRMKQLRAVTERADEVGEPAVEEVLRAFIEPIVEYRSSGPGARDFSTLISRAMAEPDSTARTIFMEQMKPVFLLTFKLLCRALPHLSRSQVFSRLQFAIGAVNRCICLSEKSPLLPRGITPPQKADDILSHLIPFVTAGMEAP